MGSVDNRSAHKSTAGHPIKVTILREQITTMRNIIYPDALETLSHKVLQVVDPRLVAAKE